MKNDSLVKEFNIETVVSLETYLFHLAILMDSIRTLDNLQMKADSLGIFDKDEQELSNTVQDWIKRLFIKVDDLYCHCLDRTGIPPEEFKKQIIKMGKKSQTKKKDIKN